MCATARAWRLHSWRSTAARRCLQQATAQLPQQGQMHAPQPTTLRRQACPPTMPPPMCATCMSAGLDLLSYLRRLPSTERARALRRSGWSSCMQRRKSKGQMWRTSLTCRKEGQSRLLWQCDVALRVRRADCLKESNTVLMCWNACIALLLLMQQSLYCRSLWCKSFFGSYHL